MAELVGNYLYVYTWKIENFLCAICELKSPPIYTENLNNTKWFMKVKSPQPNTTGHVSFHLVPNDENNEISEVACMLELLVESNESIWMQEIYLKPFKNDLKIGSENFVSLRKVADALAHSKEDAIIVKCRIGKERSNSSPTVEFQAQSLVEAFSYSFKYFTHSLKPVWNINKQIQYWNFTFYINMVDSQDNIEIYLESSGDHYICVCRVLFLQNDVELFNQRSSYRFNDRNSKMKFSFIKRSVLEKQSLNHGTITVLFEMSFSKGEIPNVVEWIPSSTSASLIPSRYKDPTTILQEDFRHMFVDQIGCDVKLRTGDVIFSAHKFTLSARSPVFKALFEQDMVENKTGIVDISDADANTLKSFLVFCYDATVDKDLEFQSVLNLLMIADKYQVDSLKDTCLTILMSTLNDENVCQVLEVADMIGSETLKQCSVGVIKNNAQKILSSDNWSQCVKNNSKLTTEVLQNVILGNCN